MTVEYTFKRFGWNRGCLLQTVQPFHQHLRAVVAVEKTTETKQPKQFFTNKERKNPNQSKQPKLLILKAHDFKYKFTIKLFYIVAIFTVQPTKTVDPKRMRSYK